MATKSIRTQDGVLLKTQSNRRYVTFSISDDSQAKVLVRTDSYTKSRENHLRQLRKGFCRVVTVDTGGSHRKWDGEVVTYDPAILGDHGSYSEAVRYPHFSRT